MAKGPQYAGLWSRRNRNATSVRHRSSIRRELVTPLAYDCTSKSRRHAHCGSRPGGGTAPCVQSAWRSNYGKAKRLACVDATN